MPAIEPNTSDGDSASDSVTPWNAINLNRPGWGDDPYSGGLTQRGGMNGLSPDLGQKIGRAILAGALEQDPRTVDPGARAFLNTVTLPLTTPSYPQIGLLGSLDGTASAASVDGNSNDDDQDGVGPNPDDEGLNSVGAASDAQEVAAWLHQRDIDYLDRYYEAANRYSQQYKVNPAFVLGLGSESGFGSKGTYIRTGDAFGMTGGNTNHMTRAASPEENVGQFFQSFGSRIYGAGDDIDSFINALQARTADGKPIAGQKMYNSVRPADWKKMVRQGINQMQRDLPIYRPSRSSKRVNN